MPDNAIEVHGLGKRYTIGGERKPYRTLRESLAAPFHRRPAAAADRTFWALKDVAFQVGRGEVVGIIGRNGAGKSTLLKVLSRITEPTEGAVDINGRVGSLLEVGTGFHPELTGRENVFLNGAILGMRRAEIARKFDEIVAFAETERFLDTPVKFYSSGMYTRLAFAVAAHLDPEILIVDEVLAVGDAEFQKKCMGKMQDVAGQGRTVLFVSHNMGAIASLCGTAVLLKDGRVAQTGPTPQVLATYAQQGYSAEGEVTFDRPSSPGAVAWISRAATVDEAGQVKSQFMMGDTLTVEMDVVVPDRLNRMAVSMEVKTDQGVGVLHLVGNDNGYYAMGFHGKHRVRMALPALPIYPGKYMLWVWVGDPRGNDYDYRRDCLAFEVTNGPLLPRSGIHRGQALVHLPSHWSEVPLGAP